MTDEDRGLKHGAKVEFFFKVVSAIGDRIGNCGSGSSWAKHAEYKFRAIADGSVPERGETVDRLNKNVRNNQGRWQFLTL